MGHEIVPDPDLLLYYVGLEKKMSVGPTLIPVDPKNPDDVHWVSETEFLVPGRPALKTVTQSQISRVWI